MQVDGLRNIILNWCHGHLFHTWATLTTFYKFKDGSCIKQVTVVCGKSVFSGFIPTIQFVEKHHHLTIKALILGPFSKKYWSSSNDVALLWKSFHQLFISKILCLFQYMYYIKRLWGFSTAILSRNSCTNVTIIRKWNINLQIFNNRFEQTNNQMSYML